MQLWPDFWETSYLDYSYTCDKNSRAHFFHHVVGKEIGRGPQRRGGQRLPRFPPSPGPCPYGTTQGKPWKTDNGARGWLKGSNFMRSVRKVMVARDERGQRWTSPSRILFPWFTHASFWMRMSTGQGFIPLWGILNRRTMDVCPSDLNPSQDHCALSSRKCGAANCFFQSASATPLSFPNWICAVQVAA